MENKSIIDSQKCYIRQLELIRPILMAYSKSRILDKHKAEDVVQDVLVILSNKRKEYNKDKSFYSWALRICNFQIKAFFTKSKRNKVLLFENPESMAPDSLGYFYHKMPFQNLIQEDKKSIKEEIMAVLGKRERQVFSLSLDGWGSVDIMYNLKINRNVYNTTKSRALKKAKILFSSKCIQNYKI